KAREYAWQLIEEVTGARMTISYTRVGGLIRDLPPNFEERWDFVESQILENMDEVQRLVEKNRIFLDRMKGVGAISKERALALGFTGPCLRATGASVDVRKDDPYLLYDKVNFEIPVEEDGDNWARYRVRIREITQSIKIIRQCLQQMGDGPINAESHAAMLPPKKDVYSNIEALMNHFKLIMPGHGI